MISIFHISEHKEKNYDVILEYLQHVTVDHSEKIGKHAAEHIYSLLKVFRYRLEGRVY